MRRIIVAVISLAGIACTTTPHLLLPSPQGWQRTPLAAVLAEHPLPEGKNISALLLGRTEALSYHLIQIRDREQPHIHATHDATVALLRGSGQLYVGGRTHEMHAGDVAVIAHGTAHYFVNTGSAPAVAFATFAPPYDGKDQVPAE